MKIRVLFIPGAGATEETFIRLEEALRISSSFDFLVVSGAEDNTKESVAELMKKWMVDRAVSSGKIFILPNSRDTSEEVSSMIELIRSWKEGSPFDLEITVASHKAHLRRIRLLFLREGIIIKEYPLQYKISLVFMLREYFYFLTTWMDLDKTKWAEKIRTRLRGPARS